MLPFCLDQGVGVIPWSPLARGFLTGNRKRGERRPTTRAKSDEFAHDMYYADADFDVVDQVTAVAQNRGETPAQIALAWLLNKPGVTAPIIGATKMHHLEEAAAAVDIRLTKAEINQIEEPYVPHQVLGHE
jgi:aryl-alcohol dehydrogenase (NADP+)